MPEVPKEDWMLRLGRDSGSRDKFRAKNQIPPMMDIMRMGGQAKGGGEDYSRWSQMPQSTNVQDIRGQPQAPRQPGEPMASWGREERYAYQHHFDNLQQGGVKQADGKISTYRGIHVEIDNRHYIIPTIWDNKQVSDNEAIKRAKAAGLNNFPNDSDPIRAESGYTRLHDAMQEDLAR